MLREDPTAWNADRLLRTLKRALIFCSDLDTRGRAYLLAKHLSIITTEVTSD